jgi:hypothetical protein
LDKPVIVASTAEGREELSENQPGPAPVSAVGSTTPGTEEPKPVLSPPVPSPEPVLSWFARSTMLGAQRIFKQTPIVGPNDWALLQKRRVAYTGRTKSP